MTFSKTSSRYLDPQHFIVRRPSLSQPGVNAVDCTPTQNPSILSFVCGPHSLSHPASVAPSPRLTFSAPLPSPRSITIPLPHSVGRLPSRNVLSLSHLALDASVQAESSPLLCGDSLGQAFRLRKTVEFIAYNYSDLDAYLIAYSFIVIPPYDLITQYLETQ